MTVVVQRESASDATGRERVELVLAQLDRLPTLSPVVARLLALTGDGDASIGDLVRLVANDPSLTACILRLVRRADLGVRGDGMTIARAVPLLGFRLVRNTVLSCGFFQALGGANQAMERRVSLWRHSLAVGCAAELLAGRAVPASPPGVAFVAGLLHDIGKIALDVCFPKSYARAWERASQEMACICEAEGDILGVDHTIAGKRLAGRWKLDAAIVDTLWLHHQDPDSLPKNVTSAQLVRLIYVADALVRRCGIGTSGSRHVVELEEAAAALRVNAAALDDVAAALPERIRPLCESLGLDDATPDPHAWAESMQHVQRELAKKNAEQGESLSCLERRCAVLDAITELHQRIACDSRVADVCAVAADVLRKLARAEGALLGVFPASSSCFHVGASHGTGQCWASVDELASSSWVAPTYTGFSVATSDAVALWQRFMGVGLTLPLWTWPIVRDGLTGAAVIAIDKNSLPAPEQASPFFEAVRHAITSAWGRSEAEKTADDLMSLHRRLHGTQRELTRQRSLSMIAQMAGGAAHELNNPLAVISGRAQMELAAATDPERRRSLETIVDQAQRASDIVSELMRFAKPEEPRPVQLLLGPTLLDFGRQCVKALALDVRHLSIEAGNRATTAFCDAEHLREMLEIVLKNAVEATDAATRRIRINSTCGASDETVRVRIEDNGVGLAPQALEHALDPFFSSRPAGRGRGLGLSRAYRLAEINGGRLWIESQVNAGTTVTIELPARASR